MGAGKYLSTPLLLRICYTIYLMLTDGRQNPFVPYPSILLWSKQKTTIPKYWKRKNVRLLRKQIIHHDYIPDIPGIGILLQAVGGYQYGHYCTFGV